MSVNIQTEFGLNGASVSDRLSIKIQTDFWSEWTIIRTPHPSSLIGDFTSHELYCMPGEKKKQVHAPCTTEMYSETSVEARTKDNNTAIRRGHTCTCTGDSSSFERRGGTVKVWGKERTVDSCANRVTHRKGSHPSYRRVMK